MSDLREDQDISVTNKKNRQILVAILVIGFIAISALALLFAYDYFNPGRHHHEGGGHMGGFGHGGFFMWIFIVLAAGIVLFIVWDRLLKDRNGSTELESKALEVLKERYAKGEISKQKFESMKKDIE